MLLEDFSKRKAEYKMKKLKYYSNIFKNKIKYDAKIKINKSESQKLIKNIEEIDKENEKIFQHYSKVEKELIEYIAKLNIKNDENEANLNSELKEMNENNLKMIDILKRKRVKILDEKRKELEQIVENYEKKETQKRDKKIYDRIDRDNLVFQKLGEAKQEMEKLVPKFQILEKDIDRISMINDELRRKYDNIKVENKCLRALIEKLHKKNINFNNNNNIINNPKIFNQSMTFKNKNNINYHNEENNNDKHPYTFRLKNNYINLFNSKKLIISNSFIIPSIYSSKNIIKNNSEKHLKNNIFISQKKSMHNQIFKKNRCFSAKNINISQDNNENNDSLNKYIIKLLKELIYNIKKKYNEKFILYTKEKEIQNKIRNLINLCVEDLNISYKEEKNEIKKFNKEKKEKIEETKIKKKDDLKNNLNNIEKKLFIFSYIYDNCLKNGEIKELKKQYSIIHSNKK